MIWCDECGFGCKLEFADQHFYRVDSARGWRYNCKPCTIRRVVEGQKARPQLRKRIRNDLKIRKLLLIENAKLSGCVSCGENFPLLLDFHHVLSRGDKIETIAKVAYTGATISKIQQELDKCVVLCVVCHRMHHAGLLTIFALL